MTGLLVVSLLFFAYFVTLAMIMNNDSKIKNSKTTKRAEVQKISNSHSHTRKEKLLSRR